VNEQRVARFRNRITEALESGDAEPFRSLVEEYEREHNVPAVEIAAALAALLQGGSPLLLRQKDRDASVTETYDAPQSERAPAAAADRGEGRLAEEDTETFRIEVGYVHGVRPGNIVGAIANVAGLEGRQIGHVDIREDHTYVGLPRGMPAEVARELGKTRVAGQILKLTSVTDIPPKPLRKPPKRAAGAAPGKKRRKP
jgi:ATP-dependent RNA helicase DeaD